MLPKQLWSTFWLWPTYSEKWTACVSPWDFSKEHPFLLSLGCYSPRSRCSAITLVDGREDAGYSIPLVSNEILHRTNFSFSYSAIYNPLKQVFIICLYIHPADEALVFSLYALQNSKKTWIRATSHCVQTPSEDSDVRNLGRAVISFPRSLHY